jgi:hypothetical protein
MIACMAGSVCKHSRVTRSVVRLHAAGSSALWHVLPASGRSSAQQPNGQPSSSSVQSPQQPDGCRCLLQQWTGHPPTSLASNTSCMSMCLLSLTSGLSCCTSSTWSISLSSATWAGHSSPGLYEGRQQAGEAMLADGCWMCSSCRSAAMCSRCMMQHCVPRMLLVRRSNMLLLRH